MVVRGRPVRRRDRAEPTPSGGACVQCHPYRSPRRTETGPIRCGRRYGLSGSSLDRRWPRPYLSAFRGALPMPTYEYACSSCHHEWETEQSIKDAPLTECPQCHAATAKRQISRGGGFILKGGGWYADLYSSSSNKPAEKSGDKPADTSSASSGGSSSEGASGSSRPSSGPSRA